MRCRVRDPESILQHLAAIAHGAGRAEIALLAEERLRRSRAGETYVACVGQFKRGKSTLLNRLLGRSILPVGTLPLTSIPTLIRHGEERVVIHFADRTETYPSTQLARWTTEAENPANVAGVRSAELFLDSGLLSEGLCLVDTPGLGSIEEVHDLRARGELPRVDAVLMVVGVDPPISATELGLLTDPEAPSSSILVIGKCDRALAEERRAVRGYVEQVVGQLPGRPPFQLFEVSATGREEDWPDLGRLSQALSALARDGGGEARRAATARECRRLARLLSADLRWEGEALDRPIEEARRRAEACRRLAERTGRWPRDLRALLKGVEAEWHGRLERRLTAEVARSRALPFQASDADPVAEARVRVEEWRQRCAEEGAVAQEELWRKVEEGAARLRDGAPDLTELIDVAPVEFPPSRFVFHERLQAPTAGPFGWLTHRLWGGGARSRHRRFQDLVEVNCWRAVGDLRDRVADVRGEFERRAERTAQAILALADRLERAASGLAADGAQETEERRRALRSSERQLRQLLAEADP